VIKNYRLFDIFNKNYFIYVRYNDYRSYISPDGTCVNNIGQIIGKKKKIEFFLKKTKKKNSSLFSKKGYINKESLECGSAY